MKPLLQFLGPPIGSFSSSRITKPGRFRLGEPIPYWTHAPSEGRPARIAPVFIWHTEPTWFRPSAQQDRITLSLSTCCATCGYQSETWIPLSPYFRNVRFVGRRAFPAVPIEVI